MHFDTLTIHGAGQPDPAYGAVMPPIYQVSTFAFRGVGRPGPFDYSRSGNPTRKLLEDTLSVLDGGARGLAFATGLAAEATALALLSAGDHLIVHDDLYGGTWRLLNSIIERQGITVSFVDLRTKDALIRAIRANTKAIWFEAVTNPLLNVIDVAQVVSVARKHGLLTFCDNTFLTPHCFRPIELGVDAVLHSTTKYLNGHSDVIGGALVTRESDLGDRLAFLQNALGTAQSPFDSYLVLRGIRTLPLRMVRHNESALEIAKWLAKRPEVSEVLHPGLESHPAHELAKRQFTGFGGTFSFRLGGGEAKALALLGGLRSLRWPNHSVAWNPSSSIPTA
ncbi:MAG: aminotransferase class I/II-fold pyridoxal phosphate-dependent enzyme [Polyangiaceae bacterium]